MDRRTFLTATCAAAASTSVLGFTRPAHAETVLRIGTLAPNGSSWMRVFNAWANSLSQQTNGQLKLQFYAGGAAGDERDAVRKMRAGQLDGAALTTSGLGQIVRSALVLQAPGVCHSYARIDAVRTKLAGEFAKQFEAAGFSLLGWGDAGQGRVFANRAVLTPDDLKQTRIWAWRDDPTWAAVLSAAGVNGVALGLPEVYPALRTNRIDAFPGTSIAAVSFQWYTKATHVTKEPRGIVIGATVLRKEKVDALAPELKSALLETGKKAHEALAKAIRKDDEKAFEAIVGKGVKPVSLAEHEKRWEGVLAQARKSLVGKLYSAELLAQVEKIAASAG
ncbi:MAG: TRAP transporter substrate-binding protein DctP [Myxococcales bacterium]|nr:TRAP transporter substrate-binding protein DctP [Myxococcales bacterium]